MRVELLIRNCGELLTLKGPDRPRGGIEMEDLAIIKDGALAVKAGKIVAAGSSEICTRYQADKVIDASGKVVMPGFVDPHTHPVFVYTREDEFEMRIKGKTYVEISRTGGGIRSSIKAVREADEERLYALARRRIIRMLKNGTTTLEAKSGYGLSTDSELKMLRVIRRLKETLPLNIIPTFLGAHEFPAEYQDNRDEYVRLLIEEMLPAVARDGLAEYCDIFTEAHVFNIDQSRTILSTAKSLGLKIRMHADEIAALGGAELAGELGAVSADHLGAITQQGMTALKKAGVIAVLLPGTIFSLGLANYAPARSMIEQNIPVALATDYNPGSCNCDSMQFIITLACLQMKMTPAEAITAATVNAAYALERGGIVGSLEPGKQADILIMDIPGYRFLPYHFGSNNVETVLKSGEIVYQNSD